MKLKTRLRYIHWAFVMTVFGYGCSNPGSNPDSKVEIDQVCYGISHGSTKCTPFGGKNMVFIKKGPNRLDESSHVAAGIFEKSKLGDQTETAALEDFLSKRDAAFKFNAKSEEIIWSGDTLLIQDIASGKVVQTYYMTEVAGILVMRSNVSTEAYGALVRKEPCSGVDIDEYVECRHPGTPPSREIFFGFGGGLFASSITAGGGLTIVLIDPAISDPEVYRSFRAAGLPLSIFGDPFVGILEATTDVSRAAPAIQRFVAASEECGAEVAPVEGTSGDPVSESARMREAYLASLRIKPFDELCQLPSKAEITYCDGFFNFTDSSDASKSFSISAESVSSCPIGITIDGSGTTKIEFLKECKEPLRVLGSIYR